MGVKVTFVSKKINIEKSDAELSLLCPQSAADHGAIFSSRYGLYIKEKDLAFRRQGYKVNRPLLKNMHKNVAALGEEPIGGDQF